MPFGRKESNVYILIDKHFELVHNTLLKFRETFIHYLERKDIEDKRFKEDAGNVHKLEHQADDVRRDILISLSKGAFLPFQRVDYIWMIELVDKIANSAEAVCRFIVLTRPHIPDFLENDFRKLIDATLETFAPLLQISKIFKTESSEKVLELTQRIGEYERKVDGIAWEMTKNLFKSNLDLSEKLHIKEFIETIGDISDGIEDAGDRFEVMIVKRSF